MRIWTEGLRELKSKNVVVFEGHAYLKKRMVGEFNNDEFRNLKEFLDKFGRRLSLDDFVDRLFGGHGSPSWKIDFRLLYSGCELYKENRVKFDEAVKKCHGGKEFLMAYGMR